MRVPQYVEFLERALPDRRGPEGRARDARRGRLRRPVGLRPGPGAPAARPDPAQGDRASGLAAGDGPRLRHIGRLGNTPSGRRPTGLILIATVNNCGAGQRVAPPGGIEPRLGTNPLCAAVPTAGDPVVLDFGTSVVAEGKVRVYYINQTARPRRLAARPRGRPTTDPSVLYDPPLARSCRWGARRRTRGSASAWCSTCSPAACTGGRSSHPGSRRPGRGATTWARRLRPAPVRRSRSPARESGGPVEDAHWAKLTELAGRLGVEGGAEAECRLSAASSDSHRQSDDVGQVAAPLFDEGACDEVSTHCPRGCGRWRRA